MDDPFIEFATDDGPAYVDPCTVSGVLSYRGPRSADTPSRGAVQTTIILNGGFKVVVNGPLGYVKERLTDARQRAEAVDVSLIPE